MTPFLGEINKMNASEIVSTVSDFVLVSMHTIATIIMVVIVVVVIRKARAHIVRETTDKTPKRQDRFLMWIGAMMIIVSSWAYFTLSVGVGLLIGGPLAYALPQWASFATACAGLVFVAAGRLLKPTIHKQTIAEKKEAAAHAAQPTNRRSAQLPDAPTRAKAPEYGGVESLIPSN